MKLKFFATYRNITGCKEMNVASPPNVWALLEWLSARYGGDIRKKLFTPDGKDIGIDAIILVNGLNVAHLSGKETTLAETDTVCIFPMVAGG